MSCLRSTHDWPAHLVVAIGDDEVLEVMPFKTGEEADTYADQRIQEGQQGERNNPCPGISS
jgi:hypothetical protein